MSLLQVVTNWVVFPSICGTEINVAHTPAFNEQHQTPYTGTQFHVGLLFPTWTLLSFAKSSKFSAASRAAMSLVYSMFIFCPCHYSTRPSIKFRCSLVCLSVSLPACLSPYLIACSRQTCPIESNEQIICRPIQCPSVVDICRHRKEYILASVSCGCWLEKDTRSLAIEGMYSLLPIRYLLRSV